jgi:hypothetical protein
MRTRDGHFHFWLLAAFPACLHAHPLDTANMWVCGDDAAAVAAETPAEVASPPAPVAGPPLEMTVFTTGGPRQVTISAPSRTHVNGRSREEGFINGRSQWTASLGYRRDKFGFRVGPTGAPDTVKFDWDADMAEARVQGDWIAENGLVVSGDLSYAYGQAGDVKGTLYGEEDVYRAHADSHGSTLARASLGLGWRFEPIAGAALAITPQVGYAWQRHDLRVRRVRLDFGPVAGLDMHHKPHWQGPWLGLRIEAQSARKFGLYLAAKRQWFDYSAESDLNLPDGFPYSIGLRQEGESQGWQVETGARWQVSPRSSFALALDWNRQKLKNGTQSVSFDGWWPSATKLDRMAWESWSASLGYRFDY